MHPRLFPEMPPHKFVLLLSDETGGWGEVQNWYIRCPWLSASGRWASTALWDGATRDK